MLNHTIKSIIGLGRVLPSISRGRCIHNLITLCKPPTRRGTRAGVSIAPVDYTRGLNFKNLIKIRPSTINTFIQQKQMTIGYLNARSVNNKASEIADFIIEKHLDVCAITETWLSGDVEKDNIVLGELIPAGFHLEQVPRTQRRGGGVAIVCKSSLRCKRQKIQTFKTFEVIEVQLASKKDCYRFSTIYRPPTNSSVSAFLEEIYSYIDCQATSKQKRIFVGDFNIHFDNNQNRNAEKFKDILESTNLRQHVSKPTHVKGHLLDLIITNVDEDIVTNIQHYPPAISDHTPITFNLQAAKPPPVTQTIRYRKLKHIDIESFQLDIQNSELIKKPKCDVNEFVNQYNETLNNLLEQHAPIVEKTILIRPNTPWFTDAISHLKRDRRKAERNWIKHKTEINLQLVKEKRCSVTEAVKKAKKKYYQLAITERKDDPKALYAMTDQLLHKKQPTILPTELNEKKLANRFANYFENKIEKIMNNFRTKKATTGAVVIDNMLSANLTNITLPEAEELKKLILSGNSKYCCLDPIPTELLKRCIDSLLPTITSIVTKSITTNTFPNSLKHAIITPLIKKRSLDSDTLNNYRPVSNLPYIGKLIEKVIVNRLNDHMINDNLHAPLQSAYRKYHSTETALTKIVNDLLLTIDNKQSTLLVMLDLSAAFDTVNHRILLDRLETDCGVSGNALAWLESYFADRTQSVLVKNNQSEKKPLKTGLPQGSILGPFCFPPYASPVFEIVAKHGCYAHMYADDTQLYVPFKAGDEQSAIRQLEQCIDEIKSFMGNNCLQLNETKTEFLIVRKKDNCFAMDITAIKIGDDIIQAVESAKNIGVMIDSNLNMSQQISSICKKAYASLKKISQIRSNLTVEATKTLVNALVTPHLDNNNTLLYGLPDHRSATNDSK